jgi:cytochrome c oxidase subunit 2
MRRRLRGLLGLAIGGLVLAACTDTLPQSSFNSAGDVAQQQKDLLIPIIVIATVIFVLVEGALVWFLYKYRHREGSEPLQVHGNSRLEIAWTIAPALILAIITVPTVSMIYALAKAPAGKSMTVYAVGHQWWWEFDYPDLNITTANELYIPDDTQVYVKLCAAGTTNSGTPVGAPCTVPAPAVGEAVVHSFWVPRLAGKQDVVPGRTNTMTIEANEPGVYPGQCAEFCGLSHAFMRFKVIAQTPTDFQAWVTNQQAEAPTPVAGSAADGGLQVFNTAGCIGCHTIGGVSEGIGGPNLTHFGARDCFAGCMLSVTEENLSKWLHDPASVKPGSFMPNLNLTDDQVTSLVAYLESLK